MWVHKYTSGASAVNCVQAHSICSDYLSQKKLFFHKFNKDSVSISMNRMTIVLMVPFVNCLERMCPEPVVCHEIRRGRLGR
jgi:hypothetical protein